MAKNSFPENTILDCLNCGSKINTSDSFCQTCGQKIKSYRLSAWVLIREVFSSIFNLDSKFAKTILNIWRPVFLIKAYVKGERRRFLNPGRLFIVSFFLLSALLSIFLKNVKMSPSDDSDGHELYRSAFKEDMLSSFDKLIRDYPVLPQNNLDTIRYELFESKKILALDSINSPPPLFELGTSENNRGSFVDGDSSSKIATKDINELSKEALFEKYKVEGLKNQLLLVQYLKFKKNPSSWTIFMVTNSLWSVVLSTFLLALFMKLLYIRNKYYYVEHVVFLMLFQSLIILALISCILLSYASQDLGEYMLQMVAIFGSLYFIICLKLYYQQGIFKTLIKSFLISMVHIFFLVICLLIVMGVSFFLY